MIQAPPLPGKTAVLYKYLYESHDRRAIEQESCLAARWNRGRHVCEG
jgi:hypothetical protein